MDIFQHKLLSWTIPFGTSKSTYWTHTSIHPFLPGVHQAALISGAQAMTDTAMCALIVQLWFDFRAAIHGPRSPRQIRRTRATLLSAPYLALLAFSLPALGAPVNFFQSGRLTASQKSFYCMLFNNNTFLISQYTILVSILIVTLIFDGMLTLTVLLPLSVSKDA
ncbi:hypothetical protein JB92DRAFT_2906097 [Gautieria morchelliformis]|nr:hypothetical protein JB92DRAFT_2906097 [Gautieria morchelliformis]